MTEGFIETMGTMIGKIRYLIRMLMPTASIGKLRSFRNIGCHLPLLISIVVDLLSCIIPSGTARTISTFDMLYRIRPRPETPIPTNGTCYSLRTMDLHMHIQLIHIIKLSTTFITFIGRVRRIPLNTITATRTSISLHP